MSILVPGDRLRNTKTNGQATVDRYDFDTGTVFVKFEGLAGIERITKEAIDDGVWEFVRAVPRIIMDDLVPKENPVETLQHHPTMIVDVRLPVLCERENTHGDFKLVAATAQELKLVLGIHSNKFTFVQQESLDLICTKLARIVRGNPNEPDHWKDIIGYATLVLETLKCK